LLLNIHDEFVVESSEDAAAEAAEILEREMAAAFLEVFRDAPSRGLVDVAVSRCWADAKE
ncbi:MAG TPA: hypothetical protein VHK45_06760, partial [Geminicoccaceae bacterium]|nr:hypothetical protein [Geminicoccaceae bacterium]